MIFIRSPLTCLDHVKNTWPKHGILRVQIGEIDSVNDHAQLLLDKFTKFDNDDAIKFIKNDNEYANVSLPITYKQYRKIENSKLFLLQQHPILYQRYLKKFNKNQQQSSPNIVDLIDYDDETSPSSNFLNYIKSGNFFIDNFFSFFKLILLFRLG